MIKNKLKESLSEWKKFKVQTLLVLDYKKINYCKIFHSKTKLTANNSGIDEAFKSMHQSIMTKAKKYDDKDWNFLDIVIKDSIEIFECYYKVQYFKISPQCEGT